MALKDDPLLGCLVALTHHYHKPYSAEVLVDGLPLAHNRLTPDLFIRAAERASLAARLSERKLNDISPLLFPAVLLLTDYKAAILRERKGDEFVIEQPESGGVITLDISELRKIYTGYAIFVRPEYQIGDKSSRELDGRKGHWFWSTIWRSRSIYRDVLVASFLVNLFVLANPLFVMNVYDRVVPNAAVDTLWVLAAGVGIVYLFDFGLKMLRSYFLEVAGKKSDVLISSMLFRKVVGLRYDVMPNSVGAFSSNLREFDSIRNFFSAGTLALLIDIPFMVLFIFVISIIGGPLVIVPAVAVPLIFLYSLIVRPSLRGAVEKTFASTAQKNGALVETLTAMETVKTQRASTPLLTKWEESVGFIARWSLKARMLSTSVATFSASIQQLSSIALIILGVYMIMDQQLTMGALIACNILVGRAIAPMAQVASLVIQYEQSAKALRTLDEIMNLPEEREPGKHYVHRDRLDGAIEFKDISFAYPGTEHNALKSVSFKMKAGERVALIGRIGSGKSTVEKLLAGLYKPQQGAITIDGIDLNQIDPVDLRRNLGYVPQDVLLFAGTLRENILVGMPFASDEQLLRAAKLAGVDQFASTHPMGFDMPVGERGAALSGGQRQAVSLARALLHNPNLLVLDEPSNSMDNASEEQLKAQLEAYVKGKSLVLITHKVALLSLVDRIIVIDQGQVVADGPKDTVLDALRQGRLQVRR